MKISDIRISANWLLSFVHRSDVHHILQVGDYANKSELTIFFFKLSERKLKSLLGVERSECKQLNLRFSVLK